jgi:hypothetical protein
MASRHNRHVAMLVARFFQDPEAAMRAIDIIILAPVIPLLPIAITWWLPWERWIPWEKVPPLFAGPYVLYCAFVVWHFHMSVWLVLAIAIIGAAVCIIAVLAPVIAAKRRWKRPAATVDRPLTGKQ